MGFVPATLVQIAGVTIPDSLVTYKNQTRLEVQLRGLVETANTFSDSIRVINPAPGGGESGAVPFSVNSPQAQLVGINPLTAFVASTQAIITLTGNNFVQGAVVWLQTNGGVQTTFATTFVSPSSLTVMLPEEMLDSAEVYTIHVENPQPTLGISQTKTLKIIYPVPELLAVSPATMSVSATPVLVTLTGAKFQATSVVLVDSVEAPTTYISPTELQISVAITQAGVHTVQVITPADAVTQAGGGSSGSVMLTVQPGVATQAEFSNVPTTIQAGLVLPTFTVTTKDQFGNVTDSETALTFANADNSSMGTISLTRTALGVSTATQVVFTQAGTYTLSAGGLNITGNNQITVEAGSVVAQVAVSGLPETLTAGDNLPAWTLNFTDALANAVDAEAYSDKVFLVVNPFGSAETYQVNIPMMQSPQGTLTTSAMQVTTAGTYSLKIAGIMDNLISGTTLLTVSPGAITQAEFIGVTTNSVAGETLPTFTVKFTDAHQNPVDVETGVSFTNADNSSTGTISLTRTALGVSTASITTFAQAGDYTLTVDGLQITGNNLISVAPPPFPMPLITGVSIVTGVLSGADIQITINGTGFTPVSDVRLNDVSLTSISYISPTEMTAVIPGAMIVQMENLITVVTPNPGAGLLSS